MSCRVNSLGIPSILAGAMLVAITPGISNAADIPTSFKGDNWSADLVGRVMLDFSDLSAENANFDLSKGELRRLRIGAKGSLGERLGYKVEINTNSSSVINMTDAYLEWKFEDDKTKLRVGHFKTPNSLDEETSSKYTSTIERAAFTDAFQFNRRLGVGVFRTGENTTFAAGVFTNNIETNSSQRGYALAARGTAAIPVSDSVLLHTGMSFRYREQRDSANALRYRQRPYSHIPGRIISTGPISESDVFIGIEGAVVHEKFWIASEYAKTYANCSICLSDPELEGGYLEAGLFFKGRRIYKDGKFIRPKVYSPITKGGTGAFSVVARYDNLNLTDGSVNGGELDTFVLGADWWPTKYTRVSLNYFESDADLGDSTSGLDSRFANLVTTGVTSESVDGFMLRFQADF